MMINIRKASKELEITLFYFILTTLLCLVILGIGPPPQMVMGHDLFPLLDGGDRIYRGLKIYQDFDTCIGPIPYLEVAVGIAIEGPVPRALSTSEALSTALIVLAVWFIYLRNNQNYCGLALAFLICLIWSAPFPIHYDYFNTSYAMLYNRQAFSLYCLSFLVVSSKAPINSLLLGVLIGTMWFIKIPAGASCLFLCLFAIARSPTVTSLAKLILGLGIVTVLFTLFLHFSGFVSLIESVYRTAHIQKGSLYAVRANTVLLDIMPALALVPIGFILIKKKIYSIAGFVAESGCFLSGAVVSDFGNNPFAQTSELPPLIFYGLYLLNRTLSKLDVMEVWEVAVAAISSFIIAGPVYLRYILGIGFILNNYFKPIPLYGTTVIQGAGFEDVRFSGFLGVYPGMSTFADKVNDGLRLIAAHPELKDKQIATLDFGDFFSFPRHVFSPDHMPAGIQYQFNVDENYQPEPTVIFLGCKGVMISKYPDAPAQGPRILAARYAVYLDKEFPDRDESVFWILRYKSY